MENIKANVMDVNSDTFEENVLNAPKDHIVLVDFWAPWCSPCRMLTPILESLAEEYQGNVTLAKVNVDENAQLSSEHQIQGIPAVKLFKNGEIVDEFVGVLPEPQIRSKLEDLIPNEADLLIEQANRELEQGQLETAESQLKQALELNPNKTLAKLGLAKIALQRGELESTQNYAKAIEITDEGYDEAQGILNRLDFLRDDVSKIDYSERLKENENDLDARFGLAQALAAEEQYQEALEEFLTILKKDKHYKDGAAKDAMLKIFTIVGPRSPLADEYRDKLEWVLY